MKILDAGTHHLSNADVLAWIQRTRSRHASESAEARARGLAAPTLPPNFLSSLAKHERTLASPTDYPYALYPSVYTPVLDGPATALRELDAAIRERVLFPLEVKYRGRRAAEVERPLRREQEAKMLTETELLMLLNHAPPNVEVLQPMLDSGEERFTVDEMQAMVDAVRQVLRREEGKTGEHGSNSDLLKSRENG